MQSQHYVALLIVAPPVAGDRLLVEEIQLAELFLKELGHIAPMALSVKLGQKDVLLLALELPLLVAQKKANIGSYSLEAKCLFLQGYLYEYLFVKLKIDLKIFVEGQAFEDTIGEGRVAGYFKQIRHVGQTYSQTF